MSDLLAGAVMASGPWRCCICSCPCCSMPSPITRMTPMDDADRATDLEEAAWADLERRIAAARECQAKPSRSTCQDCGEALETHRLAYGVCLVCAEAAEARQRLWGHA